MEPRKINTALLFLNTLGRFPVAVHFMMMMMMMIRVILMRPTTRILPQEAFYDDDDDDDDDDKGEVDEAYNTGFTPGSI